MSFVGSTIYFNENDRKNFFEILFQRSNFANVDFPLYKKMNLW